MQATSVNIQWNENEFQKKPNKVPSIRQVFAISNVHVIVGISLTRISLGSTPLCGSLYARRTFGLRMRNALHTHWQAFVAKCNEFSSNSYHLSDKEALRISSAAPQCHRSSVLAARSGKRAGHRPTELAAEWQTDWLTFWLA